MATDHKGRAEHWRALERDALADAVEAGEEALRSSLLAIASVYDKLAVRAETSGAAPVPMSLQAATIKPNP
jgi:hypothetical protein